MPLRYHHRKPRPFFLARTQNNDKANDINTTDCEDENTDDMDEDDEDDDDDDGLDPIYLRSPYRVAIDSVYFSTEEVIQEIIQGIVNI